MILETKGVDWSANGKKIVQDVSLHINKGEFVGLIGPNGSGKSTLLRTIYRILRPGAGQVALNGQDVWQQSAREVAQQTAVVAQESHVEFNFTVQQIVAMGRNPHKGMFDRDTAEDLAIIDAALERVNMAAFHDRDFRTLSGGEKQRVLIAQALTQQTPFIILDEPTNHLDIRYQLEILELIKALSVTKLAALHDLNLAAAYCDRLYLLRDGQILASGSPQEVLTPSLIKEAYGVYVEVGRHPITGQLHLAFAPNHFEAGGEQNLMNDHDFAGAWHNLTANDPNHRGETAVDLAFWQKHAQQYDANASAPGHSEATLAAIQSLVRPEDTLLDVGAGTGRFALPLANFVRQVTALDHATPMLNVLREKITQQQVNNIHIEEAAWEEAEVQSHDVVLAAWSLYRLPDIVTGMRKLIEVTRRTLIIVASPGRAPNDTPMNIYFYGALWQAGIYPDIKIVWERPQHETQACPIALIIWHRQSGLKGGA